MNTKQAQSNSWLRAWKRGGWTTRLFGRISTPSEAEIGAAAFRASLLEYPANPTALPEKGSAPTTRETSGLLQQGSFEMFSPGGSFSKTSPESSPTTSSASARNYQLWVTALRKSSSQRRKLGHPISGKDSLSWPTPTAHEAGTLNQSATGGPAQNLAVTAREWGKAKGFFPSSRPATAAEEPGTAKTAHAGETGAQPATHGEPSSVPGQTSPRRSLNPRFVAWLMGWGPGWISLAPLNSDSQEMALYRNRPLTPSGSFNWPIPGAHQRCRGGPNDLDDPGTGRPGTRALEAMEAAAWRLESIALDQSARAMAQGGDGVTQHDCWACGKPAPGGVCTRPHTTAQLIRGARRGNLQVGPAYWPPRSWGER